jgi:hypothetical protein
VSQAVVVAPGPDAALRPLSGLVGRSNDLARLLAHVDAGRSVRLLAPRGAGSTALLRSLCGEPLRARVADGVLALPAGVPLLDLPVAARRLAGSTDPDDVPVEQRRLLLVLDDRDLAPGDVATVQGQFPESVLVVTGEPGTGAGDLVPLQLTGLSEHHAVGLMEAAVGHRLSLDEGRAARWVAGALGGLPVPLVQAAAAVRDGGLTFAEIRDLLDEPPRPHALTLALQQALDDEMHTTLLALEALGDVPAPTPVVAAALEVSPTEVMRRLRRLALLGLVTTDGRDGWSAVTGLRDASASVRSDVAHRLGTWAPEQADVFTAASLLAVVGGRVEAGDHETAGVLASAATAHLPLDGLEQTALLLDQTVAWARAATPPAPTPAVDDAPASDDEAEPASAVTPEAGSRPAADSDRVDTSPAHDPLAADLLEPSSTWGVAAFLADWRRLAVVAVAAAAVIAAALFVAPMLQPAPADPVDAPLRVDLDLGAPAVGDPTSAPLRLDLAGRDATTPVRLTVTGPDADAYRVSPRRCDVDCRAAVTFTPDRSGAHLATVTATDAGGTELGVVSLTGTGRSDPPAAPARTNLAVTVFPSQPSPLRRGSEGVVPVSVVNNGPDDSGGAELVVTLPAGVAASAPGCTAAPGTLTCPLGELAAAQSTQVLVTLAVPEKTGPLAIRAEVTPTTDRDPSGSDDVTGFTYPVR